MLPSGRSVAFPLNLWNIPRGYTIPAEESIMDKPDPGSRRIPLLSLMVILLLNGCVSSPKKTAPAEVRETEVQETEIPESEVPKPPPGRAGLYLVEGSVNRVTA
jgi:hypothetical protein